MNSYRTFSWKELKAQKVTSLLILIAMILSTMMTTVIGQSLGILNAMRIEQAVSLSGKQYATFLQLNDNQCQILKNDDRFSVIGDFISIGTVPINDALSLSLIEPSENYLSLQPTLSTLEKGRLPEKAGEIALPEDALQHLNFHGTLGDTISLNFSKALRQGTISAFDGSAEFTLTGILKSNYVTYASGSITGLVGTGTGSTVLPDAYQFYNVAFQTSHPDEFQAIVDEYKTALSIPDINIAYNNIYLDALGIHYDTTEEAIDSNSGFSFMALAGVIIGSLVLFAAGLVIYNILKIAISQRIEIYGTIRALGGERKQLYLLVTIQLLLLCSIGIPLGMLIGALSTKALLTMATGLLSPEIFMVQTTNELHQLIAANSQTNGVLLVVSAAITLLFAFLAAMPAARYAAKVSPTLAMTGPARSFKRKHRKEKHIRCFESFYARLNLSRNKGRTTVTLLSLVMSITVFVALQSFISLLNTASTIEQSYPGDYALISETIGFSPETLEKLSNHPDVQFVSADALRIYKPDQNGHIAPEELALDLTLQPGETFQIAGLNAQSLNDFIRDALSEEARSSLHNGNGCIVRNPLPITYNGETLPATELHKGDTITIAGKTLTVVDTLDDYDGYVSIGNNGFTNGIQIIVTDNTYATLTGEHTYNALYPTLKEGTNRENFDQFIETLCAQTPGATSLSYEKSEQQMTESFAQTKLLAWGLILFIGLIGVLNIINTVYTNIHTRITEIGMQRAIGMNRRSLYQSFLWEGVYYGLIASIIGAIAGYICTIFISAAQTDNLALVPIPWLPILEASVAAIFACIIATCIPLRKIAKMDIVDAIEQVS